MTSSLVGSEMCIRDRQRLHRAPRDGQAHDAHVRGRRRHPPRVGPRLPVSYTHLTLPTICSV
eukprot:11707149-Prorocentrum_lima.AAC.1